MESHAIVHHRLDLILRLIDSTTGREISDKRCEIFMTPDKKVKPVARGDGIYLFLGIGREDFDIEVHVYGYESRKEKVIFESIEENMPIKEVYLLPQATLAREDGILTLRGNLPGIKDIQAVSLSDVVCSFKEYDRRNNILKVFNQHKVKMKDIHYGILNLSDVMEFDHFEVKEELTTQEMRLKKPLEKQYTVNQPISKIIFGQTSDDGEYKLAVRAGRLAYYLVRYVVDDTVYFKKIDFNNLSEQSL